MIRVGDSTAERGIRIAGKSEAANEVDGWYGGWVRVFVSSSLWPRSSLEVRARVGTGAEAGAETEVGAGLGLGLAAGPGVGVEGTEGAEERVGV